MRRAGSGRVFGGARGSRSATTLGPGRSRRRARGRPADQDVGDARHAPSAQSRDGRDVPVVDRGRPLMGAPELAALLRRHAEADRRASRRGPRRARRQVPHARGTGGRSHCEAGLPARRRSARIGLGNAPEAARLAGRPLSRTEPRKPRHVHAPGHGELAMGRDSGAARGGAGGDRRLLSRVRAVDDRGVRQLAGQAAGSGSGNCVRGSRRSATGSPRSRSTASARTSSRRTSTTSPQLDRLAVFASSPVSISTCSDRAPGTAGSFPSHDVPRSAVRAAGSHPSC